MMAVVACFRYNSFPTAWCRAFACPGRKRRARSAAASSLFSVHYRALPVSHTTEVILDDY
jgi:hypothetical protein